MKRLLLMLFFVLPTQADVQNKAIHIYQDSDLSRHIESSLAIQQGIKVAFDEIGNQIDGYDIIYKYLDHRGNVVRSKRNYNVFLDDPNALVIYSGIHSPPLIKNRVFINENKALTLVPWAAGGSITRYPAEENWIFRLSIDDTQAASEIIRFAIKDKACKAPHLLLEDTPWGDSSLLSMSEALKEYDIYIPGVTRFGWNLKSKGAHTLLNKIISKGNDCIVLVSNSIEGAVIVREVFNFPLNERLPIISHWGITGGDFHEKITAKMREKLDLHFIQSCFAFTNPNQSEFSNNVFSRLKKFSGGTIAKPTDLKSAAGFIHAYDLTKLLIQSIKQVGLTGNMLRDRDAIRLALEDIQNPVHGLIKTYNKPFSVFDEKTNNDAHEALHQENYCMGKYGVEGEILISQDKP